ncbi:S24 family peptidase [Psychrobacter sp. 2Y5]|uniref:S24 family peptidase n=1 Tax=unclassified Psychrobacter TaxID=196806 RepID=UPI003F452B38
MNSADSSKEAFAARIHKVLDEMNFTSRGRAQRIKREGGFEISDRAINKWLNAESMPDHHNIESLAKFLNVNFNWLAAGQGEKNIKAPSAKALQQKILDMQGSKKDSSVELNMPLETKKINLSDGNNDQVPVISWVAAGSFSEVIPVTIDDVIEWIPKPRHLSTRAFGLVIQGRSMWPEFKPDEIIYVEPEISPWELKDGDLIVIHCNDDKQATFKQLVVGDNPNDLYLKPLNPDWPDQVMMPMGECSLVGIVDSKYVRYR